MYRFFALFALVGTAHAQPAAPPPGVVVVESDPPGAAVMVDGVLRGRTPAQLPVAAGERAVRVSLAGYDPVVLLVRVGAGDTARVAVPLVRLNGLVSVVGLPAGSTATVNGMPAGASRTTPTGLATVVVSAPGWPALRAVVPVAVGAETRVAYEPDAFRPNRALLAVLAPGVLQVRDGRASAGAVYAASVGGGLVMALAATAVADHAESRIGLAQDAYDAAESEAAAVTAREELSRLVSTSRVSRVVRGTGLVAAGLLYAVSLVDSFRGHVRRPGLVSTMASAAPVSIHVSPDGAGLAVRF